jgi:hypothetical protein
MRQAQLDPSQALSLSRGNGGVGVAQVSGFSPTAATKRPGYRVDNPDE